MTIAISLKVNDGVILAADSASTVVTQNPDGTAGVVNVYNNANKVFNLVKGLPVGAVTWGAGSIGNASISTLMKDFRDRLTGKEFHPSEEPLEGSSYTIQDVAQRLYRFMFEELYTPAFRDWSNKPPLGFVVAGYSARGGMAEEYKLEVVDGVCHGPILLREAEDTGVAWSGEGEAVQRLLLGFGSGLPLVLQQNLGVPQDQIAPALSVIQQSLTLPVVIPAMPLQDAIDLAEFLVDVTVKVSRFAPGAPTVGGPIEVAAISKHEHFRWISRKYYYSRDMNPEEQYDRRHDAQ
jgi:hypothetical protein